MRSGKSRSQGSSPRLFQDPERMSPIPFRWGNSTSSQNQVYAKAYQRQYELYGESMSHSLQYLEKSDSYLLVPNYKNLTTQEIPPTLIPQNKTYIFVIVETPIDPEDTEKGNLQLRIGSGSHYFLANKSNQVLAAGEIEFKDGKITRINDQSGAYSLEKEKEREQLAATDESKYPYGRSILKSMKKVGLPIDKVQPYDAEGSLAQAVDRHKRKNK